MASSLPTLWLCGWWPCSILRAIPQVTVSSSNSSSIQHLLKFLILYIKSLFAFKILGGFLSFALNTDWSPLYTLIQPSKPSLSLQFQDDFPYQPGWLQYLSSVIPQLPWSQTSSHGTEKNYLLSIIPARLWSQRAGTWPSQPCIWAFSGEPELWQVLWEHFVEWMQKR